MKCPNCGHDLTRTNHGFMCVNCGYTGDGQATPTGSAQSTSSPSPAPVSTPVPVPPPAPSTVGPATHPITDPALVQAPTTNPTHNFNLPPKTPAPAATRPLAESIYPNPQHAFAAESELEHLSGPKPKSKKKLLLITAGLILLLGGGGSATAYSLYVQAPKEAPLGYLEKLSKVKTLKIGGNLSATSASGGPLNKLALTLGGSLDNNDPKNTKADLTFEGSADSAKVAVELRLLTKVAYFKVDPSPIIDTILGPDNGVAGQWFKIPEPTENSPTDDKCQAAYDKNLTPKFLSTFPIKDTKLVKLFDKVDGHTVRQTKGTIDLVKLPNWFDSADKLLPAECKFSVSKDQVKGFAVDYILWTSQDFDRMELKATTDNPKYDIDFTLDTSDYNKTVKIEVPAGAKDFSELSDGEMSPAGAGQVRDAQRKADLRATRNALETYYNDAGYYPSGNYSGLKKILVPGYLDSLPTDPGSGSYIYSPANCAATKCGGFTITATLETKTDPSYPTYKVTSVNSTTESHSSSASGIFKKLQAFVLGG